ncbi:MAG: GNAT family N-acyltransferase [Syntrophobacter sp.]
MEEMVGGAMEALFREDASRRRSLWKRLLESVILSRILPLKRLSAVCAAVGSLPKQAAISDRILDVLGVNFDISAADEARIPSSGPLVVVANHPFGAIEGLILASILTRKRTDTKIMANFLLRALGIDELNEILLFVDPLQRKGSTAQNLKPIREAIKWVRDGRSLVVFPAGQVSHARLGKLMVTDGQWSPTVAGIIGRSEATALPVYFEGRNSLLFHVLGLLHPLIRTILLPRESLTKGGRTFRVHIGKPVPFKRLAEMDNSSVMEYLRLRTYNLRYRKSENRLKRLFPDAAARATARTPIVKANGAGPMVDEIRALTPEHLLLSTRDFDVIGATATQIPGTLHEIGRLREIAFRKAGEGTGRAIDIDRFDSHYHHIVLWNRERLEVAGAYRIGPTDTILDALGVEGLYTSTLFNYENELWARINPALEVGRSFVRPEYQKTFQPLLLLWSGIGRFVAATPRYRFLFGAVSISGAYHGISRRLIIRCLKEGYTNPGLAEFVHARNPIRRWPVGKRKEPYSIVNDINDVSEIISDIEKDSKGIPILLKQYMKLGGTFLGFGVDPKFNNAIDALVLVDLAQTDPRVLDRYMGQRGMEVFLRFHFDDSGLRSDKCA